MTKEELKVEALNNKCLKTEKEKRILKGFMSQHTVQKLRAHFQSSFVMEKQKIIGEREKKKS